MDPIEAENCLNNPLTLNTGGAAAPPTANRPPPTVQNLLTRISRLRILVVGDLMLDHYIWGDVHRVSPEAPVPVVHATRDSWAAGGAANVALNLAGLGAHARVLGHIGSDEAGARLREILTAHQIEVIPTPGWRGHHPHHCQNPRHRPHPAALPHRPRGTRRTLSAKRRGSSRPRPQGA